VIQLKWYYTKRSNWIPWTQKCK